MTQINIIVATDAGGGIGINNTLPWRLPEDMAHFKRLTSGHPVIMGRKTYDSIGRPLPNRRNIVITRNPDWSRDGIEAVTSLAAAVALVGAAPAYIIGGAEIYSQAMDVADRLIVTEIARTFDCDAFFPRPDAAVWQESAREEHDSDSTGLHYAFVTYHRIHAASVG
ncbi:dihydrofolate reductase [Janthinobacterium agaricidamnosum]|uniref:Dihydrofolate reductase n=1 Tax=Janthinobacterium agaricidamnosum NBRC 102515 = DSM 9628 TaxID=1349767 RepID=W0V6F0_9BURK|nr:dihydrofolate reductase [Janthinobacterium agaricidamnosum]CDG82852.1 dihydrofolate reductase family protein [Janthinobacterium agaricidamnosum NBRC 102515 = DSM 9628]